MEDNQGWKTKVLAIGAAVGLLTGIGAAYLYIKNAEEMPEKPKLTTGDGVKLGASLIAILKMITEFGKK